MDEMSSWMSMHRYYRRMMQCIADQIDHQVHISWYACQPAGDEQPTVVLNVPHVDGEVKERDLAVGTSFSSAV